MGQEQRITETIPDETPAAPPAVGTPADAAPTALAVRRGGAPHGNTNAVAHGLYGVGLPRGAERLGRRLNAFRRSLCAAVEARGAIGLWEAATIDSACHWLRHGLLAARWLRLEHDQLSPADRLSFSREVAKASVERDRCIRALGLDEAPGTFDPVAMYARLAAQQAARQAIAYQVEPPVKQATSEAPAGRVGDLARGALADDSDDLRVPLSFG